MKYLQLVLLVVIGQFVRGLRRQPKTHQSTDSDTVTRPASGNPGLTDEGSVDSPADLNTAGWKRALRETVHAIKDKQLSMTAASLAYYATLTFFPALLGLATVYGFFASPGELLEAIRLVQGLVPEAMYDLINTQLSPLASVEQGTLGVAALITIGALLWTTSSGIQNLIKASNIAYSVEESRGLVKRRLLSIALSFVLLVLGGLILVLVVLQDDFLSMLGAPQLLSDVFPYIRWTLLFVLITVILSVVYRYAPNRREPKWSWVSWGAVAATIIWLAGSAAFFAYAQNFGNFNKTYGTFAGIIILMVWFYLTSFIVLLGAQVNKKLEDATGAPTQE